MSVIADNIKIYKMQYVHIIFRFSALAQYVLNLFIFFYTKQAYFFRCTRTVFQIYLFLLELLPVEFTGNAIILYGCTNLIFIPCIRLRNATE